MYLESIRGAPFVKRAHLFPIVRWGLTSGTGALFDLVALHFLTAAGVCVFVSNMISSFLAISFVYLTSVRYVFIGKKYGVSRYLVFICYYAISITVFSHFIAELVREFSLLPLVAKILVLPVSFLVNYLFGSRLV